MQLDQNIYQPDSDARRMLTAPSRQAWARAGEDSMKFEGLRGILAGRELQGGFNLRAIKSADGHPELKDFYNGHDDHTVTNKDRNSYAEATAELEPWGKDLLKQGKHLYLADVSKLGGMVMPLILEIELKSGKKYTAQVPAECCLSATRAPPRRADPAAAMG